MIPWIIIMHIWSSRKNSIYESWLGIGNETLEIYADNDTILNGGMFYKLSNVRDEAWYKEAE